MAPSKSSKTAASLKQAKLSFASKRATSTNAAGGKTAKATRKQPSRTPSSLSSTEPIVVSDSDGDGLSNEDRVAPIPKKRRLDSQRKKQAPSEDVVVETVVAEPETEPDIEREPLNLADQRWRKLYGVARAKMDNLEPVHANGQSMVHHILRVFDLSYEYGPCVGVSRLDRWERAHALGLNPPPEVKEILMTKEGSTDNQFSQSVFFGEV